VTKRNIICLIALALAGPACLGVPGNGERATESRDLSGFTRVVNSDSLDVEVVQGPAHAVTVSIDSNLIAHVDTHVSGQTLVIGLDQAVGETLSGPHVRVTMPLAEALSVAGSGDLRMRDLVQDVPLALSVSGSGDLSWQGAVPRIDAEVNGSGDLHLAGATDRIAVVGRGSGDVKAAQLDAAGGTIEVNGSGNTALTIRGPAEVTIRGSGDVDLFGGGTLSRLIRTGSGNLRLHP
jgi:hypothetical protein